jgi:hypothetical protein
MQPPLRQRSSRTRKSAGMAGGARAGQRRVQHHTTVIAFAATKRRSRKRRGGTTGWRARLSRHTNRAPSGSASRTNAAPRNDAPVPASISPQLIEPRHSTPKIVLKKSRLPPRSGRFGRTRAANPREAENERPPLAECVTDRPAEKDQAGKGQQIRIRDPLRCPEPNAQF